jgi:hypothetical protein
MLIAIKQVVDAAFNLSDPLRADGGGYGRSGRPISSFELYKIEARRQPDARGGPAGPNVSRAAGDTLSDTELRRLYVAEREDVIGNARFRAIRSLVGNLLLIVLAGVLFAIHWRWLKQRDALLTSG